MEKTKIIKDIGLLGTWFHLSKLINLFTFFVIAKFLSPKDLGSLSLVLSILFFFTIFPQAISDAVIKFISEQRKKSIFVKGLKWSVFSGVVLSILIYIFSDFISYVFSQQISQYIKLTAALFFITSIYEVFKGTFLGLKKVNYFVITETILYTLNFLIVILFFQIGFDIYSPLYALLIANLFSLSVSLILMKKADFNSEIQLSDNINFLSFAKKSATIPILAQLITFVFVYFLTNYRPLEELGYFYFLSKITIFTLSIFPFALNRVLLPYFSEYYFQKKIEKFQKLSDAYLKLIFYFVLISSTALYLIFNRIIPLFFQEYSAVKEYLLLFCILGGVLSFGTFPNTLLSAINRLKIMIANQLFILIFSIIFSYFLIQYYGLLAIAIIHLILYVIVLIVNSIFINNKLKIKYSLLINKKDIKTVTSIFWKE